MNENFEKAVEFILKWEGGYVNNPADPGGETKFGISKKAYPKLDIKNLTEGDVRVIYFNDYWLKAGCDRLDWPLCLVHFDTAVNTGRGRADEFKAKAFNWTDYLFLRIEFYCNLKKPEFLRGWLNRVIDLYRTARG